MHFPVLHSLCKCLVSIFRTKVPLLWWRDTEWVPIGLKPTRTYLPTNKQKDGHFAQIACWVILSENVKLRPTNCTLTLLECFCIPSIPDGLKLFFWTHDCVEDETAVSNINTQTHTHHYLNSVLSKQFYLRLYKLANPV